MKNGLFIDAIQTVGIVTIAIVLSYVVVVLEGTLNRCADTLKRVLIHQDKIIEATDRIGRRIETIEQCWTPTKLPLRRCPISSMENDMKAHPSITEERMSDPTPAENNSHAQTEHEGAHR
jgi:hypothetical protein